MSQGKRQWPVFVMPDEIGKLWAAFQSLREVANLGPGVGPGGTIRLEARPRAELERTIRTVVREIGPIITRFHEESLEPPRSTR